MKKKVKLMEKYDITINEEDRIEIIGELFRSNYGFCGYGRNNFIITKEQIHILNKKNLRFVINDIKP